MDTSGYLIAHPAFLDPVALREMGFNIARHITHQVSEIRANEDKKYMTF